MAAPGWYPDPEQQPDTERFWDGEQWQDTRESEALPRGWYPDPEHRLDTERYWDGTEWQNTRSATPPPRPPPKRSGPGFIHSLLIGIGLVAIMAGARAIGGHEWAPAEPTWTEQDCVEAVLNELVAIRSEVETPTMTEWVVSRSLNPVLDADERTRQRCGPDGRVPAGFDPSSVRDDFGALRAHMQWDRPRPTIDEITPLEEIEAWLRDEVEGDETQDG